MQEEKEEKKRKKKEKKRKEEEERLKKERKEAEELLEKMKEKERLEREGKIMNRHGGWKVDIRVKMTILLIFSNRILLTMVFFMRGSIAFEVLEDQKLF